MSNNAQIERAIAHLKAQKKPNINAAARKFGVAKSTLDDRFRRKLTSRADFTSNNKKKAVHSTGSSTCGPYQFA
jgi:helix-turn-helix, Psq domain